MTSGANMTIEGMKIGGGNGRNIGKMEGINMAMKAIRVFPRVRSVAGTIKNRTIKRGLGSSAGSSWTRHHGGEGRCDAVKGHVSSSLW